MFTSKRSFCICVVKAENRSMFDAFMVKGAIDYEQPLFFLSPSCKTHETRKWPREWLKARDGKGFEYSNYDHALTRRYDLLLLLFSDKHSCSASAIIFDCWQVVVNASLIRQSYFWVVRTTHISLALALRAVSFFSRVAALVSRVSRLCPSRARALLSLNLTKKRDCSQCKGAIFMHTKILYVTSSALWLVRSPECEWPQDVICSVIGSKYWIGMSSIVPFVLWNLSKRILLCDWLHAISTPLTTTVAKVQ